MVKGTDMNNPSAIWDNTVNTWICPHCYYPLESDGLWQEDGHTLELWACHECAVEFSRGIAEMGAPRHEGA